MPEATVRLLTEAAGLAPEVALRKFVENALSNQAPSEIADRIMSHRLGAPQEPAGWQAQAAAGTSYDGANRARSIEVPTLIVHGTADQVVDHRNAATLADLIPDSRVELVEGGHLFFWEHPEPTAILVASFLEETR